MVSEKKSKYYISLQDATRFCNYSQEYLSLRARQGKLKSAKLGRNWVTTKEWLEEYLLTANSTSQDEPLGKASFADGEPSQKQYKNLKPIFFFTAIAFLLLGVFFLSASGTFRDYANWLAEKTELDIFQKEIFVFGGWIKEKISKLYQKPSLTKEEIMEIEEKQTKTIIDKFLEELGKFRVKEITKEVKKITEVQPVKEITKETVRIDDKELKNLKDQISYLEVEIGKRLYAPGGVITQQIYIKEPVQSPKIYQENGEIVLQTLGSGNIIISAATGLHLYGSQVILKSTSLLNPLISLLSSARIEGDLTVTGNISGRGISGSTLAISGNASIGGNLNVLGDITISGSWTSNATVTAATFASAANDSTVRKSGEEVFREILPISRYDIPAQTGTTSYFRISKSFSQNPLAQTPELLPGATRVYKLIIKYADNIPLNSSSSWRVYRPLADTTSDTFVLLGQGLSSTAEGIATTTQNLTIPGTDWRVDVKLSEADAGKSLRVFQIFLAAFDKIN